MNNNHAQGDSGAIPLTVSPYWLIGHAAQVLSCIHGYTLPKNTIRARTLEDRGYERVLPAFLVKDTNTLAIYDKDFKEFIEWWTPQQRGDKGPDKPSGTWYTIAEAADYLRVERSVAYGLIMTEGDIDKEMYKGFPFVKESALDEYLQQ